MMKDDDTMTLTTAALRLRVAYSTAYNAMLQGRLDGRQTGGPGSHTWVVTKVSVRREYERRRREAMR